MVPSLPLSGSEPGTPARASFSGAAESGSCTSLRLLTPRLASEGMGPEAAWVRRLRRLEPSVTTQADCCRVNDAAAPPLSRPPASPSLRGSGASMAAPRRRACAERRCAVASSGSIGGTLPACDAAEVDKLAGGGAGAVGEVPAWTPGRARPARCGASDPERSTSAAVAAREIDGVPRLCDDRSSASAAWLCSLRRCSRVSSAATTAKLSMYSPSLPSSEGGAAAGAPPLSARWAPSCARAVQGEGSCSTAAGRSSVPVDAAANAADGPVCKLPAD
mmetsp:Transcript_14590/g.54960  ORF Transcript_14590/g.54960 Transcript_14590/m.54960 type:complete len:276 (+) Transcript_14590:1218-2045(+)